LNEFKEIKKRILVDDKVEELLQQMECEFINPLHNRYEAQLPSKFESSNRRSVQVYLNEHLPCRVRSRAVSNIDIFGLVAFIMFDCDSEDEILKCLSKSKRWICEKLGYGEFLQGYVPEEPKEDPLGWLNKVRKQRKRKLRDMDENPIYDDTILIEYQMYPYYDYYLEGLSHKIQTEFEVGFHVHSERIVFPVRNQFGEIVSVKGRTTDKNYKEKDIPKFMYLYPYNKMIEWYNYDKSLWYILEQKEIIIFEAEKSCWYAAEYGYRNTLAIGGSDISPYQVEMLKKLPLDIRIILAMDKDKEKEDVLKEALKFGKVRTIYTFWDSGNLLSKEKKQSPTDVSKEVFEFLYQDSLKRRLVN
jgi:DNA primase